MLFVVLCLLERVLGCCVLGYWLLVVGCCLFVVVFSLFVCFAVNVGCRGLVDVC